MERLGGGEVGGDFEGHDVVSAFQRGLCRHSGGVGWDLGLRSCGVCPAIYHNLKAPSVTELLNKAGIFERSLCIVPSMLPIAW